MAATGKTPIQLYRTASAGSAPSAGNLADGELALNTTDEKLYFKNASGTVKLLASSAGAAGTVTSVAASGGTTGLTFSGSPITSSGTLTLGGTLAVANGGTGATTAANARTNLGATTVGGNFFTLTNPSAITFLQVNADNTVSALDAATFRTAIGAGTGGGTVTSVSGTGTVNGITLTGTVTSSGSLTLGGTLSGVSLTTQVTGTLPVANGGTGTTTQFTAGSVVFAGASGVYSQDNANLFWDDTNNRLGIGTSSPAGRLDISGNFVSNIVAVAASAIDCTTGNFFTKTATGALTWTITNPPSSRVYSFLLELTNGGTGTQTWFSGIKWPGGTAPTLTASGVDVLGFYTDDNGTTWRGVQLMKDSK